MNNWIRIGAWSMAIGVALGALAAHGLKPLLTEASMESFQTGVRYQIIHSLALIILGGMDLQHSRKVLVFRLMLIGMICFSGSIYLLSMKDIIGTTGITAIIGPITPLGGILLISSWVLLGLGIKDKTSDR